jgi:hypothetical protein
VWSFLMRRVRLYRPDRNPLRRRWERIEAVIVMVLVLIGLASLPLALLVGTLAADSAAAEAHAGRWVTARLVAEVPVLSSSSYRLADPIENVRWQESDGRVVTAAAPVRWGMKAGDPIKVWLDETGRPAKAPPDQVEIALQGVMAGCAVVAVTIAVLSLAYAASRRILDARRAAAWGDDWVATDERWSGPKR